MALLVYTQHEILWRQRVRGEPRRGEEKVNRGIGGRRGDEVNQNYVIGLSLLYSLGKVYL